MAIEEFRRSYYRLIGQLYKFPPAQRFEEFLKGLDTFPDSKERDLAMELAPTIRGLLEAGVDTSALQNPPHTLHQHFYQPGASPEFMEEKTANQQNISGGTFNAPVGINQTFTNCFNAAEAMEKPDVQQALKTLITEVERIHPQLGEGDRTKAERKLKTLTDEVAQKDPDKEQIALSGKGLIDAAKTCAQMAPPVIIAVKAIAGLFGVLLP